MNPALRRLVPCIVVLGIVATIGGLMPTDGNSVSTVNFRGEPIVLSGSGLYRWDTVSSAAQMRANDTITLMLVLPALVVGLVLSARGSLRGRLVLAGALGFMLYTYATMCFGAAYNALFIVYVALFGLSVYSFVITLMDIDVKALPACFSDRLPRIRIASMLFFASAFLLLAWLGRVAATFKPGTVPALDNVTSMFIQAMDLGLIVPACALGGWLLLKRRPWGYLIAAVGMVKFFALGTAVSLMGVNMARHGVPVSAVELVVFSALAVANAMLTVAMLRSIKHAT